MRPLLAMGVLVLLAGCPQVNSTPCDTDDQCTATQRCRRGACGPICLSDAECGGSQVCRDGLCAAPPQCAKDTDCATGFTCTAAGQCACSSDAACASNQQCLAGVCQTRPRCTTDTDCPSQHTRCEVTQGLCLPVCTLPQDCAPSLDPTLAFALYTCVDGSCTRRCTQDLQCGGTGLICENGLCTRAECATLADCPQGQYCTSGAFGRCLAFTPCASAAQCDANFECRTFTSLECPPGFDCGRSLCLELPRCLADGDCVNGLGGSRTGYCAEGHCQPSTPCTATTGCGAGQVCVAELCVPAVCRGHSECGAGHACIDDACRAEPAPGDVNLLRLSPLMGVLEVGDSLQLHLVAVMLDGSTYPLSAGSFSVLDAAGHPSAAATVTSAGLVTAVSAGLVTVQGRLPGSAVAAVSMGLRVYPHVSDARRVIVVRADTLAPLAGVSVRGCESGCTTPTDLMTDSDGVASFSTIGTGKATFTVVSPELRSDGLPAWERASVLQTSAPDVFLPLHDNPVHGQAGFNASVSFSDVTTTGSWWAGFVATSASDLPSFTLQSLLGDSFQTTIPTLGQKIPIPSPVVLYTSPGFGIPQEVKGRSLGHGQAGTRFSVAWAGRTSTNVLTSLRSTDLLGYLGGFDYALGAGVSMAGLPWVPDTADVNGNGRCSSVQSCPAGTEDVPDYARFTALGFQPRRPQQRRTEVQLPNLPAPLDTAVIAVGELEHTAGFLPVGFASATAGRAAADGSRPVPSLVVRSGGPDNGVEVSHPALWVLAGSTGSTQASARLVPADPLPTQVTTPAFLPLADGLYTAVGRRFSPVQPGWAQVASAGATVARVALGGSEVRHVLYFALEGGQTSVAVPAPPGGPGIDPGSESTAGLEVVTMDVSASPEELWTLSGPNLTTLPEGLRGYSRSDR